MTVGWSYVRGDGKILRRELAAGNGKQIRSSQVEYGRKVEQLRHGRRVDPATRAESFKRTAHHIDKRGTLHSRA